MQGLCVKSGAVRMQIAFGRVRRKTAPDLRQKPCILQNPLESRWVYLLGVFLLGYFCVLLGVFAGVFLCISSICLYL